MCIVDNGYVYIYIYIYMYMYICMYMYVYIHAYNDVGLFNVSFCGGFGLVFCGVWEMDADLMDV